jgi:hypothetical protein
MSEPEYQHYDQSEGAANKIEVGTIAQICLRFAVFIVGVNILQGWRRLKGQCLQIQDVGNEIQYERNKDGGQDNYRKNIHRN